MGGELNMVAPDVEIDGRGVILISSEEGETEELAEKSLSEFDIKDGAVLTCDDLNQKYSLRMILCHADELKDGVDYIIGSDISNLKAEDGKKEDGAASSSSSAAAKDEEDDDDIVEISPTKAAAEVVAAPKRRMDDAAPESAADGDNAVAAKKRKVAEEVAAAADDDVVCID